MKTLPISIDLRITEKCNLNCPFCFGSSCRNQEIDMLSWFNLLDKFYQYQVRCLVVTGGEPTLKKELLMLLEYAKKKGFFIVLSSNGLNEKLIDYCEWIDVLSLPMDGDDFEQCSIMRGMTKEQYMQVVINMEIFKKNYPNKILKIGTVVSKKNIYRIENIYQVIQNVADVWKLYQVSKHSKNHLIYDNELKVNDRMFAKTCEYIKCKYKDYIKICLYKNSERNGKYLFCEPNADAMVILNGEEYVIGNFLTDFDNVVQNWEKYINEVLLECNVEDTYYFT